MRILLFTEASSAGVGRHVVDLAEGLIAANHECHVLYGTERMDDRFALRVARLPLTALLRVQKTPGLSDLPILLRLRQYIQQHGPFDILHAHSTKAGLLLRIAALGCKGAVFYTPHAPLTMNPRLPSLVRCLLALLELALATVTSRLIAVSREEADHLKKFLVPGSKISVIPNGIEEAAIPVPKSQRSSAPVCIGFLGRLSSQKNVLMLLEAFALAFKPHDKVCLAIGGTGPELQALQARAESLGIASRVNWLGNCTATALNHFDIFALPSAYEGMPYVMLEALSAGLPLVATSVGGVRSVISDGVEGFVVAPGATLQFAEALRKLALNQQLRQDMGHRAAAKAAGFTLNRMIAETASVYQQVLGTPRRSRIPVRTSPVAAD